MLDDVRSAAALTVSPPSHQLTAARATHVRFITPRTDLGTPRFVAARPDLAVLGHTFCGEDADLPSNLDVSS